MKVMIVKELMTGNVSPVAMLYDSSEDLLYQVTCADTSHLLCETNENQYKLIVIFEFLIFFPTIQHFGQ
jgi:hypothetical protein